MNTYVILVKTWAETKHIVEASSLEEAKEKALCQNKAVDPSSSVKTEAICRNFYPYRTISG